MGILKSKIAIITGGAGGIGMAAGKRFAAEGAHYVHAPIITASDCEGGGEMFQVTGLGGAALAEQLVLETDAPYMRPPDAQLRGGAFAAKGRDSEPAMTAAVCRTVAGCLGIAPAEVAKAVELVEAMERLVTVIMMTTAKRIMLVMND